MTSEPTRDKQFVTPQGEPLAPMIEGVRVRPAVTHTDERGSLTEILSLGWDFPVEPIVHVYQMTIRPGWVKGWHAHYTRTDRLFLSQGEVKFVLYDYRPESPTYQMISEICLTEYNRGLVVIPPKVFHALHNMSSHKDALIVSLPEALYDYEKPDVYRLPLNNDVIPYTFDPQRCKLGW